MSFGNPDPMDDPHEEARRQKAAEEKRKANAIDLDELEAQLLLRDVPLVVITAHSAALLREGFNVAGDGGIDPFDSEERAGVQYDLQGYTSILDKEMKRQEDLRSDARRREEQRRLAKRLEEERERVERTEEELRDV